MENTFEISLENQEYEATITNMLAQIDKNINKTYIINFKSDFKNSKIIRDFVGGIFDTFNIVHPWRGRFILITDELINNAIEHGSAPDDTNSCIITAGNQYENWYFHIMIEIHDTGNGEKISLEDFENIKADRVKWSETGEIYMQKRGRGLFHITEKIVDKLSFAESPKWGLAVKIEKCIEVENWGCSFGNENK